jgi:hypothetical protein
VRFPLPTASLALNNKAYGKGWDATLKVLNDPELCQMMHSELGLKECHFDFPGWSSELQRAGYEMAVMGGARSDGRSYTPVCPVWQWTNEVFALLMPCEQVFDDPAGCSCDHFGRPQHIDDPQTPEFEGEPKECALQRDFLGHPTAGFFCYAHGKGKLRACIPQTGICGPWKEFDK